MPLTDQELLELIAQGDQAAMEVLVYRYHAEIYRYFYRSTNKEKLSEDLAQETFLRVIRSLGQGKYPAQFRPWVYRIATNLLRDTFKSAGYQRQVPASQEEVAQLSEEGPKGRAESNLIDIVLKQELRKQVVEAIQALPRELRQVIIMRFYQELKIKDIAQALGMPEGTIKSRLHRAYLHLSETLGDYVDDSQAQGNRRFKTAKSEMGAHRNKYENAGSAGQPGGGDVSDASKDG